MRSSSTGDVLAPSSGSTLFEMLSRLSPARMSVRMPARDASVVIASITETLRFPGRAGVLAVGVRWRPSEAVGGRNDRVSGCSDAGCRPLAEPPPISGWSAIGRSMTC